MSACAESGRLTRKLVVHTENLVLISVTGLTSDCKYALQGRSVQGHMLWLPRCNAPY